MAERTRVQRRSEANDQESSLLQRLKTPTPGQPLDSATRQAMEPHFGHSFSDVRIHNDGEADQLAQTLDARAFTTGQDIYFRAGAYDPASPQGEHLLAHELTHTVQQAAGPVTGTARPDGVLVSNPNDSFEQAAHATADAVMSGAVVPTIKSGAPSSATAVQRQEADASLVSEQYVVQRDTPTAVAEPSTPPATSIQEASSSDIWNEIEIRATPELLIKLQEIGRAAGEQTKTQIDETFKPYEDSLESDQTFLAIAGIGLSGGGNMPQGGGGPRGGAIAGGLAGAASAATQLAMTKIMDFKSVGEVKAKANSDVGGAVMGALTSDSELYMNFETEALDELRTEFETSWEKIPSEQRNMAIAKPLMIHWFQMTARSKYGARSSAGEAVLKQIHSQVASQLAPVKTHLDELKESQRWNRVGAGALGGAATGALIGGALGSGVFSVPGALIGGAIGGVAGAIGGYFW